MADLTEKQKIGQVASVTLMTEWSDIEYLRIYTGVLEREIDKFKESCLGRKTELLGFLDSDKDYEKYLDDVKRDSRKPMENAGEATSEEEPATEIEAGAEEIEIGAEEIEESHPISLHKKHSDSLTSRDFARLASELNNDSDIFEVIESQTALEKLASELNNDPDIFEVIVSQAALKKLAREINDSYFGFSYADLYNYAEELNEELIPGYKEAKEARIQHHRQKEELVAAQVKLLKKAVQVAKIRTATFTRIKAEDDVDIIAGTYNKFIELVGTPVGIDYIPDGSTKGEILVPLWYVDDEAFPDEIAKEYRRETNRQNRKFKISTLEEAYNILLCEVLVKLARSTIDEIRRDTDTIIKNEISTPSEAISDPSHLSLLREREKQRIKDEAVDKKVQRNIKAANRKRGVQKNIRDARQEVKEQYDEDPELKATIEKLERLIDQDREFIKNKNKRDRAKKALLEILVKGRTGESLAEELGVDEDTITSAKKAAMRILAKKYKIDTE